MDGLRKMKLHDQRDAAVRSTSSGDSFTRVAGVVPFKWEEQPGKPKPRGGSMKQKMHDIEVADSSHEEAEEEEDAHEPRVVQLNLKASLMGVHIVDDEETFFSRQSSLSSMTTKKFRSAGKVPFKWEAEPGKPIEPPAPSDKDPIGFLLPPPGSRVQSGVLQFPHQLHGTGGRPPSGMLPYPPQAGGASTRPQISGNMLQHNPTQRDAHSGMLVPHPPATTPGSRGNSGMIMNAAFFSIGGAGATGGLAAGTDGLPPSTSGLNLTEKIFKKLVGQSRLSQAAREYSNENFDGSHSRREFNLHDVDVDSDSRVSTLDLPDSCPASPSSSERSFGAARPAAVTRLPMMRQHPKTGAASENTTRAGLQSAATDHPPWPDEHADSAAITAPKSTLAHYLVAITAMADETDDDDIALHGPSDVAWHQAESEQLQYIHPELPVVEGYRRQTRTSRKSKNNIAPTDHERWTSNSSSWNLSLVQKPLKTVSTMVSANRNKQNHNTIHHTLPASLPSRISKSSKARSHEAPATSLGRCISGRGMKSEPGSGRRTSRTWSSEIESGRNTRVLVLGSGHLHLVGCSDVESHLLEPDQKEAPDDHVGRLEDQVDLARKGSVDEDDFPFDSPVASSFMFSEADKKHRTSSCNYDHADHEFTGRRTSTLPSTTSAVDNRRDHRRQSCNGRHMPSSTDSVELGGGSLTFPDLERVNCGIGGVLDQPPQWVPSRNFNSVKELVDTYAAAASISGRALSGFVEIGRYHNNSGRSGRFSIDLHTGSKLSGHESKTSAGGKIHHAAEGVVRSASTTSPADIRLRIDVVKTQKPSRHHHSKRSSCILAPCLPFLDRHKKNVSNRIQQLEATTSLNSVTARTTSSAVAAAATTKQLQTVNSFQARLGPAAYGNNSNLDPRSSSSSSTAAQFQFY